MEVKKLLLNNSRAQFMTLIVLILFILMLSILMIFVVEEVNYQNIGQKVAISSTSLNYGNMLSPELTTFLFMSSERSLSTLSSFELSPSMRKGVFISNLSAYMSGLIANGTISGVGLTPSQNTFFTSAMGNMTLASYDDALAKISNSTFRVVTINQTGLKISSDSHSSLNISVTYNVKINATGEIYFYHLPINVSIPLNGTQDILYASQGQLKSIQFEPLKPAISMYGTATAGNSTGIIYGTVITVPSGVTCSSGALPLSNYVPSQLDSSPVNKSIILITQNATKITNSTCDIAEQFGGLMTYNMINIPNIPFLEYASTSGYLSHFMTGQNILLYGPRLAAMNETNLQSEIMNGYYFASPFTPSYNQYSSGSTYNSSPDGMFTFLNTNHEVANFNGNNSNITGKGNFAYPLTVLQWIYPINYGTSNFEVITEFDGGGYYNAQYQFALSTTGHLLLWNRTTNMASNFIAPLHQWSFVGYSLNSTYATIYFNGERQLIPSTTNAVTSASDYWVFGMQSGFTTRFFNGSMANVQLYNGSLNGTQVETIYKRGVFGLPIDTPNLFGWWPLNGNANDYSGTNSSSITHNINYSRPGNYSEDSIFGTQTSNTMAFSIPGIMSCTNYQYCANTLLPHVTLDSLPIEVGGQGTNVAQILGTAATTSYSSNARIIANVPQIAGTNTTYTAAMWVYVPKDSPSNMPFFGFGSYQALEFFRSGVSTISNQIGLHRCTSADTWESSIPLMSLDYWHFVAVSVNPPNYYFQLDNYSSNVTNANKYTNNALVVIGTQTSQCDGSIFPGNITNVQLYNASLSETTLHKLFEEGIAGKPVQSQNLVGWWPLNGNANDYSGNNNNGVAYNVTYPFLSGSTTSNLSSLYTEIQNEQQSIGFP